MMLHIISPDKNIFEGEVDAIKLPGIDGSFGILNNHAPLISALKKGQIKVTGNDGEQFFDINGGTVELMNNKVVVLAE